MRGGGGALDEFLVWLKSSPKPFLLGEEGVFVYYWFLAFLLPPPNLFKVSNEKHSKCQTMSHNRHKNKPKV